MSSVAPTSPRPPPNLRTHSSSHTPTTNNNSNGEAMQVDALPPPPITIPMNSIKQSNRNGISSSTDIDRDDLPTNSNLNGAINNSSSHPPHSNNKQDRDYSPSTIQSLSTRAHLAERRLAVLESTLSLPLTYPSALPSSPLDEKPDVSSVLKDPLTGEMDPKLRQAALAVKECEIRTDRAQALVVQRERELSRVRQDMDRLQAELNSVLAGRDTRDDLVRAKEDVARMREDAARSREMFERTREELHSAQNEIARLSSSGGPSSSSGGPPPYNNNSSSSSGGGGNSNKMDRQLLQAWDEADSFLRLCEGRMAEARALFSRILTGNRDGAGWLPPLPPPHQPVHHYPPGPPPPPRDSTRIPSPLMTRTTPIVPSNTHAPPPPPTMNYPRPPNQHPHPRHRRDRSPGPDAYNVYDDDVREGERPNKRHRAISNAGRYYPDEPFRSPPGGSSTPHHLPPPPPPPPTNTVRQYNTYPDVTPAHPPSSHGGPHPPPPSHPSHPSSQPSRHRSRSSSGSTSIDDMLLAASEVKPQGGGYHHDYKPRERGDSNASLGGGSGHYPVQAQTQTHVFAPVQTGAPVKKGKTNPSLESIPATLAPQQFYPPTNEAGQRLCRQCGMTGRYKDNKCVEKWGPGPLGPGTVCDRCRKKMKRVERRGTLEGQQSASGGAGGPVVYTHPIARTDTVVYPTPLTSSSQQQPSQSQPPSAQGGQPPSAGGGAHSPVKEHHHHSSHHSRNPLPPQHHTSNLMPSTHGSNHSSGGPPPPGSHGHGGNGNGSGNPHSNSSSGSMSQMRRPSPPPPIEVLHPSSRDGMDIDDRDRDGRDGVRDIDGDVVNDDEEIDDVDADADGDGEDIEGELLDAVDAAEKSQGGAD